MSRQRRSKLRIALSTVTLVGSLTLLGFYLWAGLAHGRWHWGFIVLWGLWGFLLYPAVLVRELRKPKELVPGAPAPNEPNLSLFQ
jgi:hypothetical protein